MGEAVERQAIDLLLDAVRLWRLQPRLRWPELIDAATDALVADLDTPSLRMLAGENPRDVEDHALVADVVTELGCAAVLDEDERYGAARVLARRCLVGLITARELASWAHSHLGHDVDDPYIDLVEADDDYDLCDYLGDDRAHVDDTVRDACLDIVAARA